MHNDQQAAHVVALRLLKAACNIINGEHITNRTCSDSAHAARQYADSICNLIKKDGIGNSRAAKHMAIAAIAELDVITHQVRGKTTFINPNAWQNILIAQTQLRKIRDSLK